MSNLRMRRALLISLLLVSGCAHRPPALMRVQPAVNVAERLSSADALLRIGCFDCLTEALQSYDAIRLLPNLPPDSVDAALVGSARALLLLDLRQRELGMVDSGYLPRVRRALETRDDLREPLTALMNDIEIMPWRFARPDSVPVDSQVRQRSAEIQKNIRTAIEARRTTAGSDLLSAYTWVAFVCTFGDRASREREPLVGPVEQWSDVPIIAYRLLMCGPFDRDALTAFFNREPRFQEVDYWLGAASMAIRRLDEAESHLLKAYAWRENWPAVTAMLANIYLAAEEFEPALKFYDRTLALVAGQPEASIGRVRALSLLGHHDQAFDAIEEILNQPTRLFVGDALYWRAWNNVQVKNLEQAWTDIEEASRVWVNSEVAKLAGVIAYGRRELPLALKRFQESRRLNGDDCEVQNYIGVIHAEQREWVPTSETLVSTVRCLEASRAATRKEIERIQNSDTIPERKAHQIARREAQFETATRMMTTAWFNIAAAYFNLGRREEARPFAERLVGDEQFGERAQDLLNRLKQ